MCHATLLHEQGHVDEAIIHYREATKRALAIDADQDDVLACMQSLGRRLQTDGRLELAARAFAHALRAPNQGKISVAAMQADRMAYALPERFNEDILRIASVENVVDADEIARLAGIASKFELISGGIEGPSVHNDRVRHSKVRWLKRTPETYWIYARLMEHVPMSLHASLPATLEELAHERFALVYLIARDELVGLVRLIDTAGSAHHRRHAAFLK